MRRGRREGSRGANLEGGDADGGQIASSLWGDLVPLRELRLRGESSARVRVYPPTPSYCLVVRRDLVRERRKWIKGGRG